MNTVFLEMEVKFKEKKLEKSNLVKALFTVYFTEQGGHKISSEIEMGLGKGKQEKWWARTKKTSAARTFQEQEQGSSEEKLMKHTQKQGNE